MICQTVESTSFLERVSCILHVFANGYQGYKSNFGFRVPFVREIRQISDQNSVFGFAKRNTPLFIFNVCWGPFQSEYYKGYTSHLKYTLLLYTKIVDSVFRTSLLTGYYNSEYPVLFTSERRQTCVIYEQNGFRFATSTNKEISQIIEEGVTIQLSSF